MGEVKKADLKSMDIPENKLRQLKQVFPEVFTEGLKVDLDKLRLTLGENVDAGRERFGMNWPGKADCFKIIQAPSVATLIPKKDESIDFDTSDNLFIEGDNLEVLKLLQKSYYGKIKMIYIDPPYNTGKDFIYPDNYSESLDTYLRYSGQINDQGRKYSTNVESDGRFHSKWLSMIYPRLYLARNLLRDDGVIFVSIDDAEVGHLRSLCDEIYGPENFCGVIKRRAARKTAFLSKRMTDMCDYVVAYVRSENAAPLTSGQVSDGTRPVFNEGNSIAIRILRDGALAKCADGIYAIGNYTARTVSFELLDELKVQGGKVIGDIRIRGPWRINQEILDKTLFVTRNFGLRRIMLQEELEKAKLLNDLLDDKDCYNEKGSEELMELFGVSAFSNPKPRGLIEYLSTAAGVNEGDIVVDFFAGSGTTGHAVMSLNVVDEVNRRYILVQLPEPLDSENKDQKVAVEFCDQLGKPRNIAELTKERLRRAINKIQKREEVEKEKSQFNDGKNTVQCFGFKVFKLTQSNFKVWDGDTEPKKEVVEKQLEMHVDHIDPKSSQDDILFELLLKAGFELTTKIEKVPMAGKTVYSIEGGLMLVCLEKDLTKEVIKAMAEKAPSRVICLDQGFVGNDQLKTNAVQIMKSKGVEDFRTV